MKVYRPKEGMDWNPLKKFRNIPCPCRSGKKAKACHGVPETLPKATADNLKQYLKEQLSRGLL